MGIKGGKKGTAPAPPALSMRRGMRPPIEQVFPDNPKDRYRTGHYVIVEEKHDYLVCHGFDPNALHPFSQQTPSTRKTIKVAKPSVLMRSPWDGTTVPLRVWQGSGDPVWTDVTFTYDDNEVGKRTASFTWDGEQIEIVQRIQMQYFVDDAIMAVEVARNAAYDGLKTSTVSTETGGRLIWMDLNNSGRQWVPAVDNSGGNHYIQAATSPGLHTLPEGPANAIEVAPAETIRFVGDEYVGNPPAVPARTPVRFSIVEDVDQQGALGATHVVYAWVEVEEGGGGGGTFDDFDVTAASEPDSLGNSAGGSATVSDGEDVNFIGDEYFETGGLENRIPIYTSIVSALGIHQAQQWADGKDIAYTFEAESNPGDRGVNPGGTADIEPRRTLQWLPTERTNERVPVWANIEESVPNNTTYLSVWIDYTDLSFQFFIDGDTGAGVTVDNQDTVSFIGQLLMTDDGQGVIRVNALGAEIVEIILNLGEVQGFDNTTNQILGHLAGQLRWLTINDCQV